MSSDVMRLAQALSSHLASPESSPATSIHDTTSSYSLISYTRHVCTRQMHSGGHLWSEKQLNSAHYATNVRLSHFEPGRIIAESNSRKHNMLEGAAEDTKGGVKGCEWCARTDTDIFAVGIAEQAQDDRPDSCQEQGRGMFYTFLEIYAQHARRDE
jgi:hypothetical protein